MRHQLKKNALTLKFFVTDSIGYCQLPNPPTAYCFFKWRPMSLKSLSKAASNCNIPNKQLFFFSQIWQLQYISYALFDYFCRQQLKATLNLIIHYNIDMHFRGQGLISGHKKRYQNHYIKTNIIFINCQFYKKK